MNRQKLIPYIQLANTPGVGPITFRRAVSRFGSVENALEEISRKKKIFPRRQAEEEIMTAELKKVSIITSEDELYPYNLKQIEDYPPLLYVAGNLDLLRNNNCLAVVGARSSSLNARKMAECFAKNVAQHGITIVSGLARGIDAAAHKGAVDEVGGTIAVLGTGIDVVYPKENELLYRKILEKGVVLTEYPFHTQPQSSNFPRRNRIVSGLSKGILVIEAGLQSGSLITAHQSLEQGRDIFAVPGAPYDNRSAGCNQLLKEGACLVDSVADILDNFDFSTQTKFSPTPKKGKSADLFEYSLDNEENNLDIPKQNNKCSKNACEENDYEKLLSLISTSGEDIDELIRISGFSSEKILSMLVELELDNKIIHLPGNKVART